MGKAKRGVNDISIVFVSVEPELVDASVSRLMEIAQGFELDYTGPRHHPREQGGFMLPPEDPLRDPPVIVQTHGRIYRRSLRVFAPTNEFIIRVHQEPWPERVRMEFDSTPRQVARKRAPRAG